ncbi:hypothetical protein DFH08DRAFT_1002604 [Mycena albidolilacea]|uniref:Uncharacterized protein n=1 Tax=Mycena albidolilacea TaxID=1033008 RepID=A0AAD7ER59_9AGAR|nr:hypothetical protein DFH08DRAFT_1002604 [Mycena albidolilacea]
MESYPGASTTNALIRIEGGEALPADDFQMMRRGAGLSMFQFSGLAAEHLKWVVEKFAANPTRCQLRIEEFFGDQDGREEALDELHDNQNGPSRRLRELQRPCDRLAELTRPKSTTIDTQLIAFKVLVAVITRYPGLRRQLQIHRNLKKTICAIRYLAGILELPSFWRRCPPIISPEDPSFSDSFSPPSSSQRQRFSDVLSTLCNTIILLVEDTKETGTGSGVDSSPSMLAGQMAVDLFCCSVLNGVMWLHSSNDAPPCPDTFPEIVTTLSRDDMKHSFPRAFEIACTVKDTLVSDSAAFIPRRSFIPGGTLASGDRTALIIAARGGDEETIRRLIQCGVNVNAGGGPGETALQAASARGNSEIVRLLLENGADVNARGGQYGTGLQAGARLKHPEVIKLLLQWGTDVNAQGAQSLRSHPM